MAAEATEHKIMPESDYDPVEAKFCASLFWLVFHATEDGDFYNIPPEITCPTERDIEGNFAVRPQVASFLCNGEVYFKVCSQIIQKEKETDSFWSMIQELSNAGYYVIDTLDEAVTEERLLQQDTFDLDAHLALLDTLMLAHVNLSVNIQNVVSAVRTFATFNAAKELPFDLEDALLLWLNKINNTNDRRIQKTKSPESSSEISPRRFRFKKDQKVDKPENLFPKLDDLQSDLADGKTLLSLVLFYCPDTLTHEEIKLSKSLTEDEIISNIELFRELCAQNICTSVFALRTEDFVYKAPELKNNLIALLGEIFTKVELEKTTVSSEELGYGIRTSSEDRGDAPSESDDKSKHSDSAETMKGNETYRKNSDSNSEPKTQLTKHADKVELSIQDELQKLKLLSSAKQEGASSGASSPKVLSPSVGRAVKNRPPLLSKRSKKQLATFGEEDRCHSTEDLSGMQLVDFDLKRSHSMTSVVGKANYSVDPSHSMRAWEGGRSAEDMTRSKSQRISLDFKPDPKPFKSQSFTKTHLINDEGKFHDIGLTELDQLNPEKLCGFRDKNRHQEFPFSGTASRDAERFGVDGALDKQTNPRPTVSNSVRASGNERYTDELVHLDNTQESTDSVSSEDLERFRSDVMQRANPAEVVGETEPEFLEAELEDDDYFTVGKITRHDSSSSNATPNTLPHGASPRPNRLAGLSDNVSYHQSVNRPGNDGRDIDDDLSTIAESSEPSTPTVYSFRSERSFGDSQSSPTIGSSYDTRNSFDDSQSPPILSDDITPLNSIADADSSWSGVDAPKSVAKSQRDFRNKFERLRNAAEQSRSKIASQRPSTRESDNERYLSTSEVASRTSYTILNPDMSIETAKAAGLPIIDTYDRGSDCSLVSARSRNDPDKWGGEPHFGRTSQKSRETESFSNVMENEGLTYENSGQKIDLSKHSSLEERRSDSQQERNSYAVSKTEALPESSIDAMDSREDNDRHVSSSKELSDNTLKPLPRDGTVLKSGGKSELAISHEMGGNGNHVHLDKQKQIATDSHGFQRDEVDLSLENNDPKSVNERAYLSLDIDDVGETSISAFGVCIEPSNLESEDSLVRSPRSKNNNWTYMEVEVREEDPRKMFGETNETYVIPKGRENKERPVNGEFETKKKPEKKDLNSTTTWSEIQQEKNSLWSQLKSPRKDKNHCITKVVDGPIINWAEYAKKREAEKEPCEEDDGM